MSLKDGAGGFRETASLAQCRTDAEGRFSLPVAAPGKYQLGAELAGFDRVTLDFAVSEDTDSKWLELLLPYSFTPLERALPDQLWRYEEPLDALGEEYLCASIEEPDVVETYRFLWLRSFHPAVLVRLSVLKEGRVVSLYKETDAPWGGQLLPPEDVDVLATLNVGGGPVKISFETFLEHFRELAEEFFWSQPFRKKAVGVDGATWILEGRREGECHVVDRWSPPTSEPMRVFAERLLLYYAGKRPYYDEVY